MDRFAEEEKRSISSFKSDEESGRSWAPLVIDNLNGTPTPNSNSAAVVDEHALLKHLDVSPTSCLPGDADKSSVTSYIGEVPVGKDDSVNETAITPDDRQVIAKNQDRRKRRMWMGLSGILLLVVLALAIALGVSASKGKEASAKYANVDMSQYNDYGPPPGLIQEEGDESSNGMPEYVADMLAEEAEAAQAASNQEVVDDEGAQEEGGAPNPCTNQGSPPDWVDISEYEGQELPAWVQALIENGNDEEPCIVEEDSNEDEVQESNGEDEEVPTENSEQEEYGTFETSSAPTDAEEEEDDTPTTIEVWNDLIDEGGCFSDVMCCFLFMCSTGI